MPTAIGWRTTRRLHQMEVTANIEVVFGMAKEKGYFWNKRKKLCKTNTN
jgi:hypothetical protein